MSFRKSIAQVASKIVDKVDVIPHIEAVVQQGEDIRNQIPADFGADDFFEIKKNIAFCLLYLNRLKSFFKAVDTPTSRALIAQKINDESDIFNYVSMIPEATYDEVVQGGYMGTEGIVDPVSILEQPLMAEEIEDEEDDGVPLEPIPKGEDEKVEEEIKEESEQRIEGEVVDDQTLEAEDVVQLLNQQKEEDDDEEDILNEDQEQRKKNLSRSIFGDDDDEEEELTLNEEQEQRKKNLSRSIFGDDEDDEDEKVSEDAENTLTTNVNLTTEDIEEEEKEEEEIRDNEKEDEDKDEDEEEEIQDEKVVQDAERALTDDDEEIEEEFEEDGIEIDLGKNKGKKESDLKRNIKEVTRKNGIVPAFEIDGEFMDD
jgi:hypothetical protein